MDSCYTLSYVVNSALADLDETSTRHYRKFFKWAVDGYRRLNLGNLVDNNIKTVRLEIDHNTNSAELPSDYINYYKVGISCGGVILNMDASDALQIPITPDPCDCKNDFEQCRNLLANGGGYDSSVLPASLGAWNYWYYTPYYHNGQYTAGFYGQGAGTFRGAFRIDATNGRIIFDSYVNKIDFVVMEYQSNGLGDCDTVIAETVIPALKAYLHWQRCLFSADNSRLEAQNWKKIWEQEVRGVVARQAAMTKHEWINTYRHTLRATPKR